VVASITSTSRSPAHRRGLVLLDVLIGGIVLSIALVAVLGVSSRALNAQIMGERRMQASMLVDDLLTMVLAVGPERYPSEFPTSGVAEPPFQEFEYEILIEDQGVGRPYLVVVDVFWMVGSREYFESVETRIAPLMGEIEEDERIPERPVLRQ